ncbi:transcriptional regulator [Acidocella aquatica]|jgi:DNA-binding XRE family transcriptional regulator|uniref:Transcriptional regulator n=1 Tax=Acidocella aquatica TaxID=1922313 RepID=A0ABQ6ACX1_9PROT|nr:hypothetical protein [Acidocella aquatica]GLR68641.1 transcriptional regulator [Acidocella aquatica]
MRSTVTDTLPPRVKRALTKLGADVALARKKRSLTAVMMAERIGVVKSTYLKVEKGDPSVALGTYAMTFFVLGLGDVLGEILDARRDDQGLLLDVARMPKRVRPPKPPRAL